MQPEAAAMLAPHRRCRRGWWRTQRPAGSTSQRGPAAATACCGSGGTGSPGLRGRDREGGRRGSEPGGHGAVRRLKATASSTPTIRSKHRLLQPRLVMVTPPPAPASQLSSPSNPIPPYWDGRRTWEEGERKQVLRQRVPQRLVVHAGAPGQVKRPDLCRLQSLLPGLLRCAAGAGCQAAPQTRRDAAAHQPSATRR